MYKSLTKTKHLFVFAFIAIMLCVAQPASATVYTITKEEPSIYGEFLDQTNFHAFCALMDALEAHTSKSDTIVLAL